MYFVCLLGLVSLYFNKVNAAPLHCNCIHFFNGSVTTYDYFHSNITTIIGKKFAWKFSPGLPQRTPLRCSIYVGFLFKKISKVFSANSTILLNNFCSPGITKDFFCNISSKLSKSQKADQLRFHNKYRQEFLHKILQKFIQWFCERRILLIIRNISNDFFKRSNIYQSFAKKKQLLRIHLRFLHVFDQESFQNTQNKLFHGFHRKFSEDFSNSKNWQKLRLQKTVASRIPEFSLFLQELGATHKISLQKINIKNYNFKNCF